ncbi:MAG: sigma-70 family RNA polymerase sigma factor [Planctomycetes bacterium]|nr:sigma-70 family RNA polymerase sigma factor [Planctomycetota bacterium]
MSTTDTTAFLKHLLACREELARFASRMLGDRTEAQDVVQESVLVAYRKYAKFDGGNFRGWMFAIVAREVMRERRNLARQLSETLAPSEIDDFASLDNMDSYADVRRDPERVLDQLGDPLRQALRDLPDAQRMVFLLRAVEGFRYRQIAEMLHIPVGTVMTHLHRARWKLRERLGAAAGAGRKGGG